MKHLHLEKKGFRGFAVAESFKHRDVSSRLAGVVIRRDLIIDDFVFGKCTIGGNDATDAILKMYHNLARDDLNFIAISGLILSMYNIVNIQKIWEEVKLPVIGVTYEDSPGIEDSIKHHFPDSYHTKIEQYYKIGKRTRIILHTGQELYIRTEGCSISESQKLLDALTLQGSVPEPLRVAQLLAKTSRVI
jgi:endonuclease V-like protein UPF0215 family